MRTQRYTWKERICAWVLVLAMLLTWMLPELGMSVQAAEGDITCTITATDVFGEALNGVNVTAVPANDTEPVSGSTDDQGVATLELQAEVNYTLTLSKAGYKEASATIRPVEGDGDTQRCDVKMEFAPIEMAVSANSVSVGDTVICTVANPAEDVEYNWSIAGEGAALSSATGTSVNVTCAKAGRVDVTVTAKGQTAKQTITVNKKIIDPSAIQISFDPVSEGQNVNKVTVTASGFPGNATGTATLTYNEDFENASVSKGTAVFTLNNTEGFSGTLHCTLSYSGDETYYSFDGVSAEALYRKTQALEIADSNEKIEVDVNNDGKKEEVPGQTITYGACVDQKIELKAESIQGRAITYELDEASQQIVNVDESGKITLTNKPGIAHVVVKAAQTDYYAAATLDYYIEAKPAEITVDLSEDLTVESTSKVYDGNAAMTVNGAISQTVTVKGQDGKAATGDELKLEGIQGTLWSSKTNKEDASVASDRIKITGQSMGAAKLSSEWYDVTYEGEGVLTGTTVTRRTLYLGAADATVEYGTTNAAEVAKKQAVVVDCKDVDPNSGFVAGETVESTKISLPQVKLDTTKLPTNCYDDVNGTIAVTEAGNPYPDVIVPEITVADPEGANYHFAVVPDRHVDQLGDLTVTQQKAEPNEVFDALEITETDASGNATVGQLYWPSKSQGELWVNGSEDGTKLTFKIAGTEMAKRYDRVMLDVSGLTQGETNAGNGVLVKESQSGKTYSGKIWFEKQRFIRKTRTEKMDITIHVDTQDPTVDFGEGWTETKIVTDTLAQILTFNHYQKSYYTIEGVTTTDNGSDESASGVKSRQYYVWKLGSDITTEDVDGAAVQAKVEELAESTNNWTDLTGTSIPVAEASSGEIEDLQGQYLVLVKVSDNVGHAAVYASNGIIIETTEPSIAINGVDSNAYYDGDVDYTVNVTDKGQDGKAVTAGIAKVQVQVIKDGKTGEPTFDKTYVVAADKQIDQDKETGGYTLEQIQNMAAYEIKEAVSAETNNSNDVKIRVTAYDQAGNEALAAERSLRIDTTMPTIEVSYDNNNAVNGTYFAADRNMTIRYTERNFDPGQATFDVTVDGVESKRVTFERLAELGIGYELVSDSQADTPEAKRTDDRVIEYKLTFAKDGDYRIVPSCTDLAGNMNIKVEYGESVASKEFTIDKTAPALDVKYYIEGKETEVSAEEAARLYTQENIKAVVSVEEHNFGFADAFSEDPKQMNLTVTAAEEPEGQEVDTDAYAAQANTRDGWSQNADVYAKSFEFTLDANYSFTLTYRDLAGNEAVYAPHYFTVDDTNPEGAVTYETNTGKETWWNLFLDLISFNRFSDKTVPVTFESKDTTAGVAKMEYYKAYEPMSKDAVAAIAAADWTEGTGFSVEPNEQFAPYLKVTDKAGNVEYFGSEFAVVADNTDPAPEIEITAADPAHGIYNGNVPYHISVTDPTAGNTYAGLTEVYYEVRKDGAVTQSGNYNAELQPASRRVKNLEKDETVNAELNNSNDVEIYVRAVDNAGNVSETTKDLKIDITRPEIAVTYDLNTPLNERYYNAVRTATVVVTERNFDESAVRFEITNTDGTQPTISGWTHSADAGVSDSATHTCTVTFAADGDYTFTLNTTDLAGNDSAYTQVDDFTIDRTVPTIQVSYDNNNAATPGYYNADRTATITVNEHNFNAAEVNAQITAALQGSGVTVPAVGGWSNVGDVHTASVTFSADADYTFDIDYTDLAGNAAADYTQDSFTVDKTDPEIEFFDIEDKSANNGTVAPGIRYSDVNYIESGVEITIKGALASHKTEALSGNRTQIANGESIKMDDFAHEEEVDDVYTMTAVIRDRAGNETQKEIVFSVNRFGSNYIFSDATQTFLDGVYSNEPQDLVVTEVNVDSLVFNGISYGLDGSRTELKEGSDYSVKQSGGDGSWKQYTYTIKKENFEKEGRYSVTIDSEDKATNKTNNKVKESNIDFVIDQTPPTVVITGIEEDSYREDSRDMTINVSDNTAVKSVEVLIDGESAATYSQAEIEKAGGKIDYTIESASAPQQIEAVAIDLAKNETVSDVREVLITSSLWIQFINNTPLLIGTILVIVLLAGGAIWFLVIRKKQAK